MRGVDDVVADSSFSGHSPQLLIQFMEHMRKREELEPSQLASAQENMISAHDRMRTRRFSRNLVKGIPSSTSAKLAEADAMESLATLVKKRGTNTVNAATGDVSLGNESFGSRSLRRQSVIQEATESKHRAKSKEARRARKDSVSDESENCPTAANDPWIRTLLRRRASLKKDATPTQSVRARI